MNVLELFCHVDDFTQTFKTQKPEKALPNNKKTRERHLSMTASEIMTILIHFLALNQHLSGLGRFHQERHRDFLAHKVLSCEQETNFLVNLMCGLIAYGHQPRKPGLVRVTDELIAA